MTHLQGRHDGGEGAADPGTMVIHGPALNELFCSCFFLNHMCRLFITTCRVPYKVLTLRAVGIRDLSISQHVQMDSALEKWYDKRHQALSGDSSMKQNLD